MRPIENRSIGPRQVRADDLFIVPRVDTAVGKRGMIPDESRNVTVS